MSSPTLATNRPSGDANDLANPTCVRIGNLSDQFAAVQFSPDERTIVAAAHDQFAGNRHSGDETRVPGERLEFRLFRSGVDIVNVAVRCTDEHARAASDTSQAEEHLVATVLANDFQLHVRGRVRHDNTSRIGLVPMSVSGTGRLPT